MVELLAASSILDLRIERRGRGGDGKFGSKEKWATEPARKRTLFCHRPPASFVSIYIFHRGRFRAVGLAM